jgi:putative DNA primase/helicase
MTEIPRADDFTELGNAQWLVETHGLDLRYVRAQRRWYCWDGQRWRADETGEAERRMKAIVPALLRQAAEEKSEPHRKHLTQWALECSRARTLEASLRLTTTEQAVAVTADIFDRDPWLLGVANGVLDLRTGELRAPRREDYITMQAPVAYDPRAVAPRWSRFLADITREDPEAQQCLQRVAGYCLTGDAREQQWFFLYGPGGNGKTCFVEVVRGMLGDYATAANFATFLARGHETIREDVARLEGARLVTALEPPENERFNEPLLKHITGGDMVTGRRQYQASREYRPTFKLLLAGNHKPQVWGTDEGWWRRIRTVPFLFTVPPERRVKDYHRVLLAEEGPGILRWAMEGCLDWQRSGGLGEPASWALETAAYRHDEDVLGEFVDSCLHEAPGARVAHTEVRRAYEAFCAAAGLPVLGARTFVSRLRERGYTDDRTGHGRWWRSLSLSTPPTTPPATYRAKEDDDAPPF